MAWPIEVKAKAIAMLLFRHRVTVVSANLGVPKQTVSRWKAEADALFRDIMRTNPRARALVAELRQISMQLRSEMGLKKGSCS